jgi:hypothetical protein
MTASKARQYVGRDVVIMSDRSGSRSALGSDRPVRFERIEEGEAFLTVRRGRKARWTVSVPLHEVVAITAVKEAA